MAKPKSEGFPYCQQDTDTFFDVKIRMLISRHGCDGYALWDYIKQAAYREHGYYVEWTEERQELAAADLYMTYEKIGLILDYLLKRSLLDHKPFSAVKVLTSHGIQKRFQCMARDTKRTYCIEKSIWLLGVDETLGCISLAESVDNSGIKRVNSGIKCNHSGMKQQKESKEKESKANAFDAFWIAYPRKEAKAAAQKAFEKLKIDDAVLVRMLKSLMFHKQTDAWTSEDGRYIPYPGTWLNGRRWEDTFPEAEGLTPPVQTPVFRQREVTEEMTAEDLF